MKMPGSCTGEIFFQASSTMNPILQQKRACREVFFEAITYSTAGHQLQ